MKRPSTPLAILAIIAAPVFASLGFAAGACACSPAAKAREAEAGYLAQQLRCVDEHDTRTAIDACRAEVRARWAAASRDGGPDGATEADR